MSHDRATILILARAGSRGVPGKNHAPRAGRPCVAWPIDDALAAGAARVALTTDDPLVARAASDMGVPVLDRPPDLATDTARVDDAVRDALRRLDLRTDWRPADADPIIILYANVPVRPPGLVARALDLLAASGADSVQSYAPVGKHHPWWTARVDPADGRVRPWEGDVLNHGVFRRQDLPPASVPDGGVLAVTRRALALGIPGVPAGPHAFLGLERRGIINPEGTVVDIDSPADLLVADLILSRRAQAAEVRA